MLEGGSSLKGASLRTKDYAIIHLKSKLPLTVPAGVSVKKRSKTIEPH